MAAAPSSDAFAAWLFVLLMANWLLAAAAAAAVPASRVAALRTPQAAVAGHSPNQG